MKINILIADIAQELARASGEDQAHLLNQFALQLKIACKSEQGYENQMCDLANKLDFSGRRLIKDVAEYIDVIEREGAGA